MVGTSAAQVARQSSPLPNWLAPVLAAVAALAIAVAMGAVKLEFGVYWIIGLALGTILQRSRFCFAGSFRDFFLSRDGRMLRAILLGLMVSTFGFWLLMARLVPDPSFGSLPPKAHVIPVGLHLIVGGLVFGIGMVVAGGCVSGTLFRIGEGYTASMVALFGIMGGLLLANHTWNWWWTNHISKMPIIWLPNQLGHGASLALVLALLFGLYLLVMWWETKDGPTMPSFPGKPDAPAFSFTAKLASFQRNVLHKGWPYLTGAMALAVLNTFAFIYDHPLGVTGEISNWGQRIGSLLGVGAPPLLGLDQFAGCNLALEEGGILNPFLALDAGLIFGSFVAALASNEFKIRVPRQKSRYLQGLGGGLMMGYGAGVGIGCTLGGFFSAIPSLSVSGWVFGAALAGGAYLGTLAIKRLP